MRVRRASPWSFRCFPIGRIEVQFRLVLFFPSFTRQPRFARAKQKLGDHQDVRHGFAFERGDAGVCVAFVRIFPFVIIKVVGTLLSAGENLAHVI